MEWTLRKIVIDGRLFWFIILVELVVICLSCYIEVQLYSKVTKFKKDKELQ